MVIVCDFDDTTADRNVATLLLPRFQATRRDPATPHWTSFRDCFRQGKISLMRYQELSFSWLSPDVAEEVDYVRQHARLRPGFYELAVYCKVNDIPLVISSHGLEFYVEALLSAYGLEYIPRYTVQTIFTEKGLEFRYPSARPTCSWWPGNCKCAALSSTINTAGPKIYVGDGASDICPAGSADMVFARDVLLDHCRENGVDHRELGDFYAVLEYLQERRQQ